MKTLFLTSRSPFHQQQALQAAPPELDITMLRDPDPKAVLAAVADAEILISERAGRIDRAIIEAGKKLRLIQRLGSQIYDIDLEAAAAHTIPVCYWPIPGAIAVAEQMLWQMLALARHAHEVEAVALAAADWGESRRTDENTFAVNWSQRTSPIVLWQKTIGILGFGEIGMEVARRLGGFNCHVLYHKRNRLPHHAEVELGISSASAETLTIQSDFLCCLLPYSPETDIALNAEFFSNMKPGAYLVSCGSGSVIDEHALAAALQSGHLAGAALDTFEYEPLRPDNPLLSLAKDPQANVILTPHTAAISEYKGRQADFTNVRRLLLDAPLLYRLC